MLKKYPIFFLVDQSDTYFPCPTHRIEAPKPLMTPAMIKIIVTNVLTKSVCSRVTGRIPAPTQSQKQNAPSCIDLIDPRALINGVDRKLQMAKVI